MDCPRFNAFDLPCSAIEQITSKSCEVEEVKMINEKQGKSYGVIH
jgi:hypothetical protein